MVFENNQLLNRIFSVLILVLSFGLNLSAQNLSYALDSESSISIEGTSTFHDWKATVGEFSGSLMLGKSFNAAKSKKMAVEKVALSFQAESIDGGRGAAMNKKIKAALKSSDHPTISFSIDKSQVIKLDAKTLTVTGNLAMAGVTKEVTLSLESQANDEGVLAFVAKYPMKLSTFEIDPPSAMFGQIVTGDDITIVFDLKFSATNN